MKKIIFFIALAVFFVIPVHAEESKPLSGSITTQPDPDPALSNDASPNNVPNSYPDGYAPYPTVSQPQSDGVRPYTLPQHRFLAGSIHHPNPPMEDPSFKVNEENKTVQITDSQQLYGYKDWAQERFMDAKFETINKRFVAIETKLADLDKRLAAVESKTK